MPCSARLTYKISQENDRFNSQRYGGGRKAEAPGSSERK